MRSAVRLSAAVLSQRPTFFEPRAIAPSDPSGADTLAGRVVTPKSEPPGGAPGLFPDHRKQLLDPARDREELLAYRRDQSRARRAEETARRRREATEPLAIVVILLGVALLVRMVLPAVLP